MKHDTDYRGKFSPFRKEVNPPAEGAPDNSSSSGESTKNVFTLKDYNWYPEEWAELENNIVDYSYDKINPPIRSINTSGQRDTEENYIKSMAGVSVDSGSIRWEVQSTGLYEEGQELEDAINKRVAEVRQNEKEKLSREYNSGGWFEKFIIKRIPKAIITEFTPNNVVTDGINKLKKIFKMAESVFSSDNMGGVLKQVFSEKGMKDILKDVLGGEYKEWNDELKIMTIPSFFYRNMIAGYFTAQYEVPFFDKSEYHKPDGANGWQSTSLKSRMFGSLADVIGEMSNSFDIASKPKWTIESGGSSYSEITCEFYLHNYNSNALAKNFKFLHTLIPGNMWFQNALLQHSSSLYDIEIPGRFKFYLCKASINTEFIGKVRMPSQTAVNKIVRLSNGGLNISAIQTVPDAYKVTISFTPIIPYNLNTYLNYMLTEYNEKYSTTIGSARKDVSGTLLDATAKSIENANKSAEAPDEFELIEQNS